MMNSRDAKTKFELRFQELGECPCIRDAIDMMVDFYRVHRVEDCEVDKDGDMLLYQWGTYDWGEGRWFDINITRQFMPSEGEDDEIFQLSLTLKYACAPEFDALGSGNRWCSSPSGLNDFIACIDGSAPMQKMAATPCDHATLEHYPA